MSTDIAFLSVEEVLRIHEILAVDFARANDPISPAGVRSIGLLESAVHRQHTGSGSTLKYPTPIENAATLVYGLCNDHPFHNGNKRTALVAMLAHLDKNHLCLMRTKEGDLFNMILGIASHSIAKVTRSGKIIPADGERISADDEVAAVVSWLKARAEKPQKGERNITYRDLRRILEGHGFYLDSGSNRGNSADVYKEIEQRTILGKMKRVRKHIGAIGYHSEGVLVSIKDLKLLRKICELDEIHGVDSNAFYDADAVIDGFINKYRKTLTRLSKR